MTNPTINRAIRAAILTELVGVNGRWHTVKVGLYKSNTALSNQTVLADLTEADFTGYAQVSVTPWLTPVQNADGTVTMTAGINIEFQATDAVTPNTVYGWFIVSGTSPNQVLEFVQAFDAPVPMMVAGAAKLVTPVVTLPNVP